MKKKSFILLGFFLMASSASLVWAGNLEQGSELLLFNKPAEAAPFLENALKETPSDPRISLWLGLVYEQLNQYDKAIGYLQSALDRGIGDSAVFCLNIGNNYAKKGSAPDALKYYTMAISAKPTYATAILNRGNTYVRTGDLSSALTDYQNFLAIAPNHALSPDVARMIAAIKDELGAREAAKKAEEDKKIAEEQHQKEVENQRLADAAKQKQDEDARKKLLDSVFNSLNDSSNEQKNLNAGNEDVQNKQDELKLEE